MLEIVPLEGAPHVQAGGSSFVAMAPVAMAPVESSHRIILPRRSGESRFAPPQYWYAASKSGVMPSPPLTTFGVSQHDERSDTQREAA
jgi:hypothetical protein